MYKSNGLEAYHLISDDGGNFLYEGSVEFSEAELFKDEQGKAYYRVTSDIGPSKYYVEVEPEGTPLQVSHEPREKPISSLVMSSPRIEKPLEEPVKAPEAKPPEKQPDTCFEGPENPPEEPKQEPPAEKPSTTEEAQAAVKAMASLGEHKPHKKSSLPVILGLLLIILIAVGAGIAIYKPDLISSLPFISTATPTPEPAVTPTPTPEPTATPSPTEAVLPGGSDIYRNLLIIAPAIDSNNESVKAFVANYSDPTGTSFSKLARICDLFDEVNSNWTQTNDDGTPQNVSESVRTLKGSAMDYSVLMAALAEAEGMESRVVAVYDENSKSYAYYPEVKAASNDTAYEEAKVYLRARYDVQDPYGHASGVEHWLSLSMGKTPGGYVDTKYAYAVNSKNEISPV